MKTKIIITAVLVVMTGAVAAEPQNNSMFGRLGLAVDTISIGSDFDSKSPYRNNDLFTKISKGLGNQS